MKKLMVALVSVVGCGLAAQAVEYKAVTVKADVEDQFSCITNAASWNPAELPQEGYNYSVLHNVFTPSGLTSYDDFGATFPGALYQNGNRIYPKSYSYFKGGLHLNAAGVYLSFASAGAYHMKGDLYCDNWTGYVSLGTTSNTTRQDVYWDDVALKGDQRLCMVADHSGTDSLPSVLHWTGDMSAFTSTIMMALSNGKVPYQVEFPNAVTFNASSMTIQDGIVLRTTGAQTTSTFKTLAIVTKKAAFGYAGLDPVNDSVNEITTCSISASGTPLPTATYFLPTNGTVKASTLTISDGVTLIGRYDGTAASSQHPIEVTTKLTLPSGKKVKVRVDYMKGVTNGPGNVAILSVPTSVKTISVNDFELVQGQVGDIASGYCLPTVTNMAVTVENGIQTLRLYPRDIVRLIRDQDAVNNPADRTADAWSDGKVPHAGVDYYANGYQMRLSGTQFAGASLSVDRTMATANLIVDDLRFGPVQIQCYGGLTWKGHARLLPHASNWASVLVYSAAYNNNFLLPVELSDAGNLWIMYRGAKTDALWGGTVYFTGLNTNWTGKVRIACQNGIADYKFDEDKHNVTVVIEDERNLGGKLDAFTCDALKIADMNILAVTNDVTVADGYNRGIFVDYFARMKVPAGKTLALNRPITYNGLLRKEDAGTLAIGAAALFKDGQAASMPMANSNLLFVTAGFVKPTVKGALDGLAITFSDGGGLEVDAGSVYGLYDQKTGGSVTGSNIPLRIKPAAGAEKASFSAGLVSADTRAAAEELISKFAVQRPRGYVISSTETVENADGTWTVKAQCDPSGMILFIK